MGSFFEDVLVPIVLCLMCSAFTAFLVVMTYKLITGGCEGFVG